MTTAEYLPYEYGHPYYGHASHVVHGHQFESVELRRVCGLLEESRRDREAGLRGHAARKLRAVADWRRRYAERRGAILGPNPLRVRLWQMERNIAIRRSMRRAELERLESQA